MSAHSFKPGCACLLCYLEAHEAAAQVSTPTLSAPSQSLPQRWTLCCGHALPDPSKCLKGNAYGCPDGNWFSFDGSGWLFDRQLTLSQKNKGAPSGVGTYGKIPGFLEDGANWSAPVWRTPKAPVWRPACECGAAKVMGAKPFAPGHSDWCAVAKK